MRLNPNHEKDGQDAWDKYKLSYGQKVKFEGEEVTIIGIGYGLLLDGKAKIDTDQGVRIVDVKELEV
jgi:hypothetical protein